MIELSKKYCRQLHKGVLRNSGNPYHEHPMRVGDMVSQYTDDENVIISSYLHDVLEHGSGTEKEIKEVFNERVFEIIKELTNDNQLIKIKGKLKYIIDKFNTLSEESLLIKLCDRYDNMVDDGRKLVYRVETVNILKNINRPLNKDHKKIITLIRSLTEN